MVAEIVSIGDELLIGQVVNTNAAWIADELGKASIQVGRISAISDNPGAIKTMIDEASQRSGIVLITGGLGPTRDDITKQVLAEYFGSQLVFHEPTFRHIEVLFGLRNYPVTEVNRRQAMIPDNCIPLHNEHGTAPGMWFEREGKIYVSLPGVPFEMKVLMQKEVMPRLIERFSNMVILHKTIMTTGMGESMLAEKIASIENSLPDHIKLAYLPQPGIVRLRLSAVGNKRKEMETELGEICNRIRNTIPKLVFGFDDISIEEVVGKLLREQGKTLATAESCTGGYIAHMVTSIPGSSAYFRGSAITYSNDLKVSMLGVNPDDIDQFGAVSRQVVEQMAMGIINITNADFGLATSGIAGPDGGTSEKPVGTIWIALAYKSDVESFLLQLGEHRGRNIRRSSLAALNLLRLKLSDSTVNLNCE